MYFEAPGQRSKNGFGIVSRQQFIPLTDRAAMKFSVVNTGLKRLDLGMNDAIHFRKIRIETVIEFAN